LTYKPHTRKNQATYRHNFYSNSY